MSINDKLYSTLGPAQRVVAVVSAMARRDDPETTRLMDTAPVSRYQAQDLEFWRRLRCAERMGMHALVMIEQEATTYLHRLAAMGILVHQPDFDLDMAHRLEALLTEAVASIKAYWLAYATTCADIGLEPVELLASMGVALSPAARMLTEKETEPDAELLASASALMQQLSGRN